MNCDFDPRSIFSNEALEWFKADAWKQAELEGDAMFPEKNLVRADWVSKRAYHLYRQRAYPNGGL